MKRRTIGKITVLAVVLIAIYPLYQYWMAGKEYENIKNFFDDLSRVLENVGAENDIGKVSAYREELVEWNRKTGETLNRFFSNYRGMEDSNIDAAINIVQTLMDDVYELRNETVPFAEPLFTERMLNPRTVKDDAEYEWRMRTLDDAMTYAPKYKKRLLEVSEAFRATVVGSDLPEKYRAYIWGDWADQLHHYITLMGPPVEKFDGMANNYKKLFQFLHEYANYYYIDEKGDILFEDKRYAQQYQRLLLDSGLGW